MLSKRKYYFFDSIYNLFITNFEVLRKYLNDNLKKKLIVSFLLSANAFIMFVKKSKKLRLCVDYKDVNFITVKNRYFISLIKQSSNRLIEIAIFTKFNFCFAYNALRIRIDDEWKTAFRCRYEHFEYCLMFFKLTNASANFQSYIHLTLRKYLNILCIIDVDNVLINLYNKEIDEKDIRLMFETLCKF